MAITRKELDNKLESIHPNQVEELEKLFDKKLLSEYTGRPIIISLSEMPHKNVCGELKRRYAKAGWKINFDNGERLGNYVQIRP
jgi:hypothetical protein